jgi:hypothetical protein
VHKNQISYVYRDGGDTRRGAVHGATAMPRSGMQATGDMHVVGGRSAPGSCSLHMTKGRLHFSPEVCGHFLSACISGRPDCFLPDSGSRRPKCSPYGAVRLSTWLQIVPKKILGRNHLSRWCSGLDYHNIMKGTCGEGDWKTRGLFPGVQDGIHCVYFAP